MTTTTLATFDQALADRFGASRFRRFQYRVHDAFADLVGADALLWATDDQGRPCLVATTALEPVA